MTVRDSNHIRCRFYKSYLFLCILAAFGEPYSSTAAAQTIEWIRQKGTNTRDAANSASADGLGNVFIAGESGGHFSTFNTGGNVVILGKYNALGENLWYQQLGTTSLDEGEGVSVDGLGNVYVSGVTTGSLDGTNAGSFDAFVSKFSAANGSLLWTRQLGTSDSDGSSGVSADALGNVFVTGHTWASLEGQSAGRADAFVSKYNSDGDLIWTRQWGEGNDDFSSGASADGLGNVYIAGVTGGLNGSSSSPPWDSFLIKYDHEGTILWSRTFGTSSDYVVSGISSDGNGNVYICGATEITQNIHDAFVTKYDSEGNLLWSRELGTNSDDRAFGVSADPLGYVYITGITRGSLGSENAGGNDAFVSKYDDEGTLLWTKQFGTTGTDFSRAVAADALGNVFFTGDTTGSLEGTNKGNADVFVGKIGGILTGDYNNDYLVNAADYVVWRNGLTAPYTPLNVQDYDTWRQNFGGSFNVATLAGAVPEPATWLLLLTALLALVATRKDHLGATHSSLQRSRLSQETLPILHRWRRTNKRCSGFSRETTTR